MIIASISLLTLTGCKFEKPQQNERPTILTKTEGEDRFEVVLVSQFKDDLAYYGRRGVYIVKDKETGTQYVGVSGIGISELGSHQSGKNHRVRDER